MSALDDGPHAESLRRLAHELRVALQAQQQADEQEESK